MPLNPPATRKQVTNSGQHEQQQQQQLHQLQHQQQQQQPYQQPQQRQVGMKPGFSSAEYFNVVQVASPASSPSPIHQNFVTFTDPVLSSSLSYNSGDTFKQPAVINSNVFLSAAKSSSVTHQPFSRNT